jgi:hypothetical protein
MRQLPAGDTMSVIFYKCHVEFGLNFAQIPPSVSSKGGGALRQNCGSRGAIQDEGRSCGARPRLPEAGKGGAYGLERSTQSAGAQNGVVKVAATFEAP